MFKINPTFARTKEEITEKWEPCRFKALYIDSRWIKFYTFRMKDRVEIDFFPLDLTINTLLMRVNYYPNNNNQPQFTPNTVLLSLDNIQENFTYYCSFDQSSKDEVLLQNIKKELEFINEEDISDMLWFVLFHTNAYTKTEEQSDTIINVLKSKFSVIQEQKIQHNWTVLQTLQSFKFYNDINNVLLKYL